jgi:hypothetical protein
VLCALSTIWAAIVSFVGGLILQLGTIRVSSHNPRNAVLIAVVCMAAVWALSTGRHGGPLKDEWIWWIRQGRAAASLLQPVRRWLPRSALTTPVTIAAIGISLDIFLWAGPPPLWLDEEAIALNIRDRSFADLAGPLWLGQSAPFGWLVMQRVIVLTLGTSELALRLIPLLFGIATVVTAVWVGHRWMGKAGTVALVVVCGAAESLTHYRFEVKHYTADGFWGLLLPALAVWAIEGANPSQRMRRAIGWWLVAAVAHFFANGALLVTPACAVVLLLLVWRRDGRQAAATFVLVGLVWIAAFLVNYQLSIRNAHESAYLRGFWASALPPESAGLIDRAQWLIDRVQPLARDPGGTQLWKSLWLLAICGFTFAMKPSLGGMFSTVPLAAFAFAALGLVPLRERLAIWIVPSLYVGLALAIDKAVRVARHAGPGQSWLIRGVATAVLLVAVHLCVDISRRGWSNREVKRIRDSKHRLDDARSARWLMARYQPGDAIIATRLTWPALWWYGEIPLGEPTAPGPRGIDWEAMYEVAYSSPGPACERKPLQHALMNHRRVLVYIGFRDERKGFDELLLRELGEIGAVIEVEQFADLSRLAVIQVGDSRAGAVEVVAARRNIVDASPPLDGCARVRPAEVW